MSQTGIQRDLSGLRAGQPRETCAESAARSREIGAGATGGAGAGPPPARGARRGRPRARSPAPTRRTRPAARPRTPRNRRRRACRRAAPGSCRGADRRTADRCAATFGDRREHALDVGARQEDIGKRGESAQLPEIARHRRAAAGIHHLHRDRRPVAPDRAVHLADRGGRRAALVEFPEMPAPVRSHARRHGGVHGGGEHGGRGVLEAAQRDPVGLGEFRCAPSVGTAKRRLPRDSVPGGAGRRRMAMNHLTLCTDQCYTGAVSHSRA
ncbi:hypothetical protein APR11_001399 [Nocardia amikacinitolerans]|nr:hypothetical protein [Nocardia amikacinitolerans]